MKNAMRVCVESPLRGDVIRNVRYADACMIDCFQRDEAPFFGHLLYPYVLDDADQVHRDRGIAAHCAWLRVAELVAVYTDFGVTDGMRQAIELAQSLGIPVEYRTLEHWWHKAADARPTYGFARQS
jgi:hypothetical protein